MQTLVKYALSLLTLCSLPCLTAADTPAPIADPAVFYNMVEIVCSEGYSIQEHEVMTEDGYILTIYRIPNNKKRAKVPRKTNHYQNLHKKYHPDFENCVKESRYESASGPPVLLAHGLFVASDSWILQGPKYDLAYMLLEEGYDVWFSNIRGNFYSRRHVRMRPTDPAFWDFSFHEFGTLDIPAMIDHILNVTGYKKLFYIGHSMGTTMFFVMGAMRPQYREKVTLFLGMAPVGQLKRDHFEGARGVAARTVFRLFKALQDAGVHEFMARDGILGILAKTICAKGSIFQNICHDLVFSFTGYHSKLYLRKIFPMIVSHGFSGTSLKVLLHFQQMSNTTFQSYDHGPEENLRRYGQSKPLVYDVRNITTPVALFFSYGDYIVTAKDSMILTDLLPNIIQVETFDKFSHTDFSWAYNGRNVVYNKIIALMKRFRNQ